MGERDWRLFPEENPNLVIETDTKGTIRYANPEALLRFPDIVETGWRHPLLVNIHEVIGGFATGDDEYVSREVDLGDAVFEQKICFSSHSDEVLIRVYCHDVTALSHAEKAMQELARRVVVAQEEERHRVSRELHDEAGQALAALKISLQLMEGDVPEDGAFREGLRDAVELVETTRDQIRIIARDLRPPVLDGVGLDKALAGFCSDFARRTQLAIDYSSDGLPELSDAVEMCLFRLLQESLSNVAVHAGADRVRVELGGNDGEVSLEVTDNGAGFDADQPALLGSRAGMGILGMRERIELLNGTLTIDSAPGRGTRITAVLPIS